MSGLWSFRRDGVAGECQRAVAERALDTGGILSEELLGEAQRIGTRLAGGPPRPRHTAAAGGDDSDTSDVCLLIAKAKATFASVGGDGDSTPSSDDGQGAAAEAEPLLGSTAGGTPPLLWGDARDARPDPTSPASSPARSDAEDVLFDNLRRMLRGGGSPGGSPQSQQGQPDDLSLVMQRLANAEPVESRIAAAGGSGVACSAASDGSGVALPHGGGELYDPREYPSLFEVQLHAERAVQRAPIQLPGAYDAATLPPRRQQPRPLLPGPDPLVLAPLRSDAAPPPPPPPPEQQPVVDADARHKLSRLRKKKRVQQQQQQQCGAAVTASPPAPVAAAAAADSAPTSLRLERGRLACLALPPPTAQEGWPAVASLGVAVATPLRVPAGHLPGALRSPASVPAGAAAAGHASAPNPDTCAPEGQPSRGSAPQPRPAAAVAAAPATPEPLRAASPASQATPPAAAPPCSSSPPPPTRRTPAGGAADATAGGTPPPTTTTSSSSSTPATTPAAATPLLFAPQAGRKPALRRMLGRHGVPCGTDPTPTPSSGNAAAAHHRSSTHPAAASAPPPPPPATPPLGRPRTACPDAAAALPPAAPLRPLRRKPAAGGAAPQRDALPYDALPLADVPPRPRLRPATAGTTTPPPPPPPPPQPLQGLRPTEGPAEEAEAGLRPASAPSAPCRRSCSGTTTSTTTTVTSSSSSSASVVVSSAGGMPERHRQRLEAREALRQRYHAVLVQKEAEACRMEELRAQEAQLLRQQEARQRREGEAAEALLRAERRRRRDQLLGRRMLAADHHRGVLLRKAMAGLRRGVRQGRAEARLAAEEDRRTLCRRGLLAWRASYWQWQRVRLVCRIFRCVELARFLRRCFLRGMLRRWRGVARACRLADVGARRVDRTRLMRATWVWWQRRCQVRAATVECRMISLADASRASFAARRVKSCFHMWRRRAEKKRARSRSNRFRQRMFAAMNEVLDAPFEPLCP